MNDQAVRRQGVVPFIVRWSGESAGGSQVVVRRDGKGIRYADERSYDRDGHGVLWSRTPSRPGRGTPQFGTVHGLRQRLAMDGSLCHICGQAADRDADGTLWLVDTHAHDLDPEVERTFHPPVCEPCVHLSVRACPHLRHGWTALRVRTSTPYGVRGALFAPARPAPVPTHIDTFPYGNPFLPWVRAGQLIVELRDFTVVRL